MNSFVKWGLIFPFLFTGWMRLLHEFYFKGGVCNSDKRLDGKTVVITGANTGIGLETSVDLASRGARVVMACRSLQRSQVALEQVKTRAKSNNVVLMKLDLGSMDSIDEFAEEFRRQEKRLDILVNNAGIMAVPKSKTADGFESQIGINHLGHFLLTNLLLDMIEESGPGARIVTVSSLAHRRGMHFNVSDLMMEEKKYDKMEQYANSKLANILFTKELAVQLKDSGVTTYAVHPGLVQTDLFRSIGATWFENVFMFFTHFTPLSYILKTPTEGAQTTICCAVSDDFASQTGQYYADCEVSPLLVPQASDQVLAKQLWDLSMELVGLTNAEQEEQKEQVEE